MKTQASQLTLKFDQHIVGQIDNCSEFDDIYSGEFHLDNEKCPKRIVEFIHYSHAWHESLSEGKKLNDCFEQYDDLVKSKDWSISDGILDEEIITPVFAAEGEIDWKMK